MAPLKLLALALMGLHPARSLIEDLSVDLSFDFDALDGWAQTAADLTQLDVKAGRCSLLTLPHAPTSAQRQAS